MPYDPLLYSGSAPHYVRGRPPYSAELAPVLRAELGLDGTGRLLDVGCGPGPLALALAPLFAETIGVDPDAGMLAEAERLARASGHANVRFVRGLAEELGALVDGRFRAVSFGQSFHRTERERVAEWVYDALEPGGALVLVAHTVEGRPEPEGPGPPPIPHAALVAIVERYLGARRRAGSGFSAPPTDRWEHALARTRFGGRRARSSARAPRRRPRRGRGALRLPLAVVVRAAPLRRAARGVRGRRCARSSPCARRTAASGTGPATPG